jgi:uncharacterized MAPEG superfamily protein
MVEICSMSVMGITTKTISAQSRFVNQENRRGCARNHFRTSRERSGLVMRVQPASATNTSRELGSVFGVAVVNAHLTGDLAHRLKVLKIPANFISIINAVETGTVPSGVKSGSSIEGHVIQAAYGAFRSGLEESLVIAGVGMLIAAGIAARSLGPRPDTSSESVSFEL